MEKRHLISLIFTICLSFCHQTETPDCGCGSVFVFTIKESPGQEGFIYKNTDQSNNNIPKYNFGIWYAEQSCTNCVHKFLICNDSAVDSIASIPAYPGIKVKFSGEAMRLCSEPFKPADYTYNFILLTKIQKL